MVIIRWLYSFCEEESRFLSSDFKDFLNQASAHLRSLILLTAGGGLGSGAQGGARCALGSAHWGKGAEVLMTPLTCGGLKGVLGWGPEQVGGISPAPL